MEVEIARSTSVVKTADSTIQATGRLNRWRALKNDSARLTFGVAAVTVCLLVILITAALVVRAWPILQAYPLTDLLTGQKWQPMRGLFGFAPFIVGSVAVTSVAMMIAVVPAIFSGIYLAEYTSNRARTTLKPVIDLLVGIPSVVYGLWGVLFIVPLVRDYIGPWSDRTLGQFLPLFARTNPSGYGLLAAGFVLAFLALPPVGAGTGEVARRGPPGKRRARIGILAAVVLGFSRAFGETLAVMMLVGNTVKIPGSLFDAAYPLPALIANNYGEIMSVPLYESALMGAALVLLVVVMAFNVLARLVITRLTKK